ncbi:MULTISPECIES: DUF983 domain-containing protein [Flammeovirga]|uniref:DUF983 domain-containing protein n=1 Tax=Flammeovirga agarivorans TaxID=2726742 RepID=A0A7X8SLN0_9BACT|nr:MULTISPECIES: DUF983 domain-containing protein [Flammeovirga]NLR92412.1 DUF983 domain-containing protein [Flammeovirga agarivorans]
MSKSKLSAIIEKKCPSCRQGDMFTHSALSPKFHQINDRCPHCGTTLNPETGFYYGAMYVSYGINTAIMFITIFAVYFFLDSSDPLVYIAAAVIPMVVLMTFVFRLSRSIYLHLFGGIDYDKSK